jgi:phosphate transport system substrate-binding protein
LRTVTLTIPKRLVGALLAGALVVAAWGGAEATPAPTPAPTSSATQAPGTTPAPTETPLTGTVRIDGSSTVGPLTEVAAELFENYVRERGGNVNVEVAIAGTSAGFGKFCIGESDMNNASRPIKQSEIDLCGQNNIKYEGVQVANDALALVVNPQNPISCLTTAQTKQIWDADSAVMSWADVDGLNVPADFLALATDPNRQLGRQLYGPGTDSGTFDFFTEAINGKSGQIRTDYNDIGEDDNAAVTAVTGVPHAMGYIPYSYFTEVGDRVKPLSIDAGNGCVEPTLDNVLNGSYKPLGRPLFIYASDTALARAEVLAFIDFYIENAKQVATLAGFVPMSDAQIATSKAKVDSLIGR